MTKQKDWYKDDEYLSKWIRNKSESTKMVYGKVWLKWIMFYKATERRKPRPVDMVDEFERTRSRPMRDGGAIVANRIEDFYTWLVQDCKNAVTGTIGLAPKTATTYVGAMLGFYRQNTGYRVGFTDPSYFSSRPTTENQKMLLKPEVIQSIIEHIDNFAYKAFARLMFESGSDLSTICSLNVSDIALNREWQTFKMVRDKIDWSYFTHCGPNGTKAIRIYLERRFPKLVEGKKLNRSELNQPLFQVKSQGGYKRMSRQAFNRKWVDAGYRAKVVKKNGKHYSPARPYALRSSFSTLLTLAECPQKFIDYWQGHKTPYDGAYLILQPEVSLKKYREYYNALAISSSASTELREEIKAIVMEEVEYIGLDKRTGFKLSENIITKTLEALIHGREATGGKSLKSDWDAERIADGLQRGLNGEEVEFQISNHFLDFQIKDALLNALLDETLDDVKEQLNERVKANLVSEE